LMFQVRNGVCFLKDNLLLSWTDCLLFVCYYQRDFFYIIG
jgi:hypothetical protein